MFILEIFAYLCSVNNDNMNKTNGNMKKYVIVMLVMLLPLTAVAYKLQRVAVHDPSIVWDGSLGRYFIFGSHRAAAWSIDLMSWNSMKANWKTATSSNASNATAFTTPEVTTIRKGDQTYDFNFNAFAWSEKGSKRQGKTYSVDGNMWAPDVVWNPVMNKWCMYLSINGDYWYSSIILLTADKISGPYRYQAPVVVSGFFENDTYKETDLELVIGTQTTLPARYKMKDGGSGNWGERYPNCIDPCVFYDEDGKLWMSYGSWSGGIWMLELDETTGLRDYDTYYVLTGSGNNITIDPYFGKKIAGGNYVSGEASYIEHIGDYYFLFVSYGGLAAGGNANDYNNGGYQMRVFRSTRPDGPYKDYAGVTAVNTSYQLNFGANANTNRGVNIFGAYTSWGNQATGNNGERSQGHNSIIAAEDGRTYLVYHTRFQNRGEQHEVRVHQVFQNQDGWLVAAPFEYTGEEVKNAEIATTQQIATNQIPGKYKLLTHKYKLDHTKKETVSPVEIELNEDGSITGNVIGNNNKWSVMEGTSYINITLNNLTYKGVMVEQTLEPTTTKVAAFTATNSNGVSIWGYKYEDLPSGIFNIKQDVKTDGPLFDLQGSRITSPQRGSIYIQNGNKFVK